jgi:hypothetical protein
MVVVLIFSLLKYVMKATVELIKEDFIVRGRSVITLNDYKVTFGDFSTIITGRNFARRFAKCLDAGVPLKMAVMECYSMKGMAELLKK